MRIFPLLISIVLPFIWTQSLSAQNCGCADEGNCPYPFPANNSSQVCYEITDAFNNNLASPSQGVCGVYVKFRHGRVGGLDLTLTAPDGTQVQLIGSSTNCNTWTPIALWDILFVPCSAPCHPDTLNNCSYPCQFNGCPANCPWANANFSGSYRPFNGCLEDFDSGPVNGQWCLDINNNAQFNGGEILDFKIILCDQSGILCCEADAGNLNFEPDVNACIGDSTLNFSPTPLYGALLPDPGSYGYAYAIFDDSTLLALDTAPMLQTFIPGTYEVCGLSFLLADTANLPNPGAPLSPLLIDSLLSGPTPPFCGDISTNCILVQIAEPPDPVFLNQSICQGDTLFIGNEAYASPGTYSDTLTSFFNCDSVVHLTLSVLPVNTTLLTEQICEGDFFQIGDSTYVASGNYSQVLLNSYGCDSTVFLSLTTIPTNFTSLTDTICQGDTVWIGNSPYASSGFFTDTISSFFNCDSIVSLNLTVVQINVLIQPADTLDCQQPSVTLNALGASSTGNLNYLWTWPGNPPPANNTNASLSVSNPGTYLVQVENIGCTSSDTVQVFQNAIPPAAVIIPPATDTLTCAITSLPLQGNTSTGNGTLTWFWSLSPGNNPLPNPALPNISISAPGNYQLVVTDLNNNCSDTSSIAIYQNIVPPQANAGQDTMISCISGQLQLNGSNSLTTGPAAYAWSPLTTGNILPPANVATPIINAPGTYQLIVTDLDNSCQDSATVTVLQDTLAPDAIIQLPQGDDLTCALHELPLDGSASSAGTGFTAQWLGPVVPGPNPLVVTTLSPGVFTLLVTDTQNGCTNSAYVSIGTDTLPPVADAGDIDTLDCTDITAELGSPATSQGPEFTYAWSSSPEGSFITPLNLPFATADSAGIYYLTVLNTDNGCQATDSVVISGNFNPPQAHAGPDGILTCQLNSALLDASASQIIPFSIYKWIDTDGNLISGDLQLTVNYPDTFIFSLSFAFCQDLDTAVVTAIYFLPATNAGPDLSLDCTNGTSTLDGSGSATGPEFTYLWTPLPPAQGGIASGATTLTPVVNEPGSYQLSVTNNDNLCIGYDTVVVTLDTSTCGPFADAGADGLINCKSNSLTDTLQASGSIGPQFSYQWTALSGNIANASNPFSPVVSPGIFVFTVTNTAVGLTASDTVLVVADTTAPLVEVGNELLLSCPELTNCYQLDGGNTAQGPGFAYEWTSFDGSFCGPSNVLQVQIKGEGIYGLVVTDLDNGCAASDALLVRLFDFAPVSSAGADIQIPCSDTVAVPLASGSSEGPNFSYEWLSPGGEIIQGGNTLAPTLSAVNPLDTFYLVVTNSLNSCRDTDFVVVFAPIGCFPQCSASALGQLDCDTDAVSLSAAGSSTGPLISFLWAPLSPSASLCGGETTSMACANAAGIYQLTVTRTYDTGLQFSSNCLAEVMENKTPPVSDAGADLNLTCQASVLLLGSNNTSTGAGITYAWTPGPGASIAAGENSQFAQVTLPGNYYLLTTNTFTACAALDSVAVGVDTLYPVAFAGPGGQLTCSVGTLALSGSSNLAGMNASWTSPNGDICAGATTFSPVVCDEGIYLLTVTNPANGCADTDSTFVTKDGNLPNPDAGPDLFYTCGQQSFTLNASASGTTPLQYLWTAFSGGCISGPVNILQPTVNCPGNYQLQVTDLSNGCTAISQMAIVPDTLPPVANAGTSQVITCLLPTVGLDGSGSGPQGNLLFDWYTPDGHFVSGQSSTFPLVDSAGTYYLIATNLLNQCKDTASVLVTSDAVFPTAAAGPDASLNCTKSSLQLSGAGSSTYSGLVYSWSQLPPGGGIVNGQNSLNPLVNLPGTYVLLVLDTTNSCSKTDTVQVLMDTLPPDAIISPSQNLVVNCLTSLLTLSGGASSPAGSLSFSWSTSDGHIVQGANGPILLIDSGGVYHLTVINTINNCRDSVFVNVAEDFQQPEVLLAPAPELNCYNPSVQLQVFPPTPNAIYTYFWSGQNNVQPPDSDTPRVSNPGVYFLEITNMMNGCSNTGSLIVTQDFSTPPAKATSLGNLNCQTLTTQLSAAGSAVSGVNYAWTTSSGGNISDPGAPLTMVDAPGWYFLTVLQLDNGCTATDSAEVISTSNPIQAAWISLDQPDCREPEGLIQVDSISGGTAPFAYSLDSGIFIAYPRFSYLDADSYQVTIRDRDGCEWSGSFTLTAPGDILLELGDDQFIAQGESATIQGLTNLSQNALDTVFWKNLPAGVPCPDCLSQTLSPLETTTYHLTVLDTNGCVATDKVTVFVTEQRPFYAPTAFSPNGDGVNDRFLIFGGPEVAAVRDLQIYDRWGNRVFAAFDFAPNDPSAGWDGNFEGQAMKPGVFAWKAALVFADGSTGVFYGDLTLVR